MKPSTLTPTGAPNTRGFHVKTHDGLTGRTYHRDCYIRTHINVHLETSPGVYSEEPKRYTRDQLHIIGYIN